LRSSRGKVVRPLCEDYGGIAGMYQRAEEKSLRASSEKEDLSSTKSTEGTEEKRKRSSGWPYSQNGGRSKEAVRRIFKKGPEGKWGEKETNCQVQPRTSLHSRKKPVRRKGGGWQRGPGKLALQLETKGGKRARRS